MRYLSWLLESLQSGLVMILIVMWSAALALMYILSVSRRWATKILENRRSERAYVGAPAA